MFLSGLLWFLASFLALFPLSGSSSMGPAPVFAEEGLEVPYPHGDFREECSLCHQADAWKPAVISSKFNHARFGFPLDGAHAAIPCTSCHVTLEFIKVEDECSSCHQDPHDGQLGVDCGGCHTTRNFIDRSDEIRTHQSTRFPLTGAHLLLPCEDCHRSESRGGLVFVGTPIDCVDCHESDFTRTTSPDHVASGLDRDCTLCHSSLSWRSGQFDHNASGFPLTGAHAPLQCSDCHRGNQFSGQSTDCFSCHQQDFETAANPNHSASGFSTSCADCHSSQAWRPASFDHAQTSFPLTGAHNSLDCQQCHTGGATGPLAMECIACHDTDYQQAPGHVSSNFPTTCEDCHSTVSWAQGVVDHSSFPLTGGHSGLSCQQCHTSGTFTAIPADCASCHMDDYQRAPDHTALNFPLDCESCHKITSWSAVSFFHSFPLRGHHDRRCTDCHLEGTTQTFSCSGTCHQHTQSKMDRKHRGVSGYIYEFQACLSCHPDGRN